MTDHRCDLTDLNYDDIDNGLIRCTECPRVWQLVVRLDAGGRRWARWTPHPCPGCRTSPCRCNGRRNTPRPAARGSQQRQPLRRWE